MIYLDNSATTKQYDEVTDIMVRCMKEDFGNPSSLYQLGVDSEKIIKSARRQLLETTGDSDSFDVVFTSGGTEADNMAIFGAAKSLKRSGNRIVTTKVEHPAVLECMKALEEEGFEIVTVGVDRQCRLNMAEMESAINEDTVLVSVMQVNNEAGTIMPIDAIKDIMKKNSSPGVLHCDAVQGYGKLKVPAAADLISVSGHKIHGPKGSGALFFRKGKAPSGKSITPPAFILGGGQESGLRSGTQNVAAIAGLGLAAEMSLNSGREAMLKTCTMRDMLRRGLKDSIEDILINSPEQVGREPDLCCPTLLNVSFRGTRGEVILHTLEQDGIFVSTGSACSSNKKGQSHVLKAMGIGDRDIESAIRFSLGRFTTTEDIEITIDRTAAAVKRFRKLGSFR